MKDLLLNGNPADFEDIKKAEQELKEKIEKKEVSASTKLVEVAPKTYKILEKLNG